jgi:tetratricopeptide (TPR) repeat protein
VQLAPESGEAHETLGWAFHLGGQPAAALDSLLRARELSPATARVHYRLGEVYWALGQVPEAMEAYQRAIDLDWHGPIGQRARDAMGR